MPQANMPRHLAFSAIASIKKILLGCKYIHPSSIFYPFRDDRIGFSNFNHQRKRIRSKQERNVFLYNELFQKLN